jgi:hypothetical protein
MDAFILVVGVPLLAFCTVAYRRGSLRGGLLLTGTLGYFLYNAISMTFNYAYNALFLVYVALFAASLFAFVLAFTSFDPSALAARFSSRLPHRGIAAFLFVVSLTLSGVWLGLSIFPALVRAEAPAELASYTTLVTHGLDLGIIVPAAAVAGFLVLRRVPFGYLLASTLLVISSVLGAGIIAYSAAQMFAGLLAGAQFVGFVIPFIILTVVGGCLTGLLLRYLVQKETGQPMRSAVPVPLRI